MLCPQPTQPLSIHFLGLPDSWGEQQGAPCTATRVGVHGYTCGSLLHVENSFCSSRSYSVTLKNTPFFVFWGVGCCCLVCLAYIYTTTCRHITVTGTSGASQPRILARKDSTFFGSRKQPHCSVAALQRCTAVVETGWWVGAFETLYSTTCGRRINSILRVSVGWGPRQAIYNTRIWASLQN